MSSVACSCERSHTSTLDPPKITRITPTCVFHGDRCPIPNLDELQEAIVFFYVVYGMSWKEIMSRLNTNAKQIHLALVAHGVPRVRYARTRWEKSS